MVRVFLFLLAEREQLAPLSLSLPVFFFSEAEE